MSKAALAAVRRVDSRILYLRDQKIILDSDLAELYGVEVRHLNQQVKRNSKRFPGEFLFQLSSKDVKSLRSQFVISNNGRGGRRYMPYAFTEYGAIMAATILNSERASNEHFRGEGLRANAPGSDHESADRRQT